MEVRYGPYLWYFLWSFVLGVALAVVYDILRLSRRIIKTCDLVVNIEDILFLMLSGAGVIAAAYINNNGSLRAYGVLGTVLGFAVYRLLLGMKIVNLFVIIFEAAAAVICKIIKIVLLPIKVIVRITRRTVFVTIGTRTRRLKGKIALKFAKRRE